MLGSLWRRFASLIKRDRLVRELDEELQSHYDELKQALENEGHAPRDAARLARLRLGGAPQIRKSSRDEWRLGPLEGLAQDFRIAFRSRQVEIRRDTM